MLSLLAKFLLDVVNVLSLTDEGGKHHIHTLLNTKLKVFLKWKNGRCCISEILKLDRQIIISDDGSDCDDKKWTPVSSEGQLF